MSTTPTLTKPQQAFGKINEAGDVAAGVRLARAVARAILLNTEQGDIDEPTTLTPLLAGDFHINDQRERSAANREQWESVCRHILAAYVIGIALGQLTHPAVFDKDETR